MALLLTSACAPRVPAPSKPAPVLTEQTPFGPRMTLAALLNQALNAQYPPPKVDFPPSQWTGEYFVELAREPVTLHLASEATAFALGPGTGQISRISDHAETLPGLTDAGLAVGLANGDIRVWSPWPCPAVTLPEPNPVTLLAWDGAGPFLGAGNAREGNLHVFDLRHCAQVKTISWQRSLRTAALSPSLTWNAVVDAGQGLHVGLVSDSEPGSDPSLFQTSARHVGTLRFPPLALAFSPREGLLQSVDQAGWLLLWTLTDGNLLDQTRIPGGPFDAALFHQHHLVLRPMPDVDAASSVHGAADSTTRRDLMIWDIPKSRLVPIDNHPEQSIKSSNKPNFITFFQHLELEAGMLTFRTAHEHWLRKLHFGTPRLSVHATEDGTLLRVTDLDQTQRWYETTSGLPAKAPHPEPENLRPLGLTPDATVHWRGTSYILADPVLARDGQVLLARYVPEHRFFLWWVPAPGILADSPDNGLLPIRRNLRKDLPPAWISLSEHLQIPGEK